MRGWNFCRLVLMVSVVLLASPAATVAAEPTPTEAPSKSLLLWIDVCVVHLGSADPEVRESATIALRATGEAARPALEAAAADGSELAGQLLERMNRVAAAPPRPARAPLETKTSAPSPMPERLPAQLDLDEQQTAQVEAAFSAWIAAQQDLVVQMRAGEIDRTQATGRQDGLRLGLDAMLAEILTEKQMARFQKLYRREEAAEKETAE